MDESKAELQQLKSNSVGIDLRNMAFPVPRGRQTEQGYSHREVEKTTQCVRLVVDGWPARSLTISMILDYTIVLKMPFEVR